MAYRIQRIHPSAYAIWRSRRNNDLLVAICRTKRQAERWIEAETGQNGLQGENTKT